MHVMHLKDGKATESWVVSKDQVATDASGVSPATGAGYRSLVRDGPADARCCMWRSAATARLVTRDRGGAASPAMLRRVTRTAAVHLRPTRHIPHLPPRRGGGWSTVLQPLPRGYRDPVTRRTIGHLVVSLCARAIGNGHFRIGRSECLLDLYCRRSRPSGMVS